MNHLDTLAFLGFLLSTMLSLGLQTEAAQLRAIFSARFGLLPMLLANFMIAPLLGLAIVRVVPMPAGSADALLILACVPGGLSALQFTRKQKGQEAVAGAVVVLLSVLAVFVSPVLVRAVLPGDASSKIPYLRLLGFYALFLLVPLGVGMLLERRRLLATTTSMRNAALALAVARESPEGAVILPSLIAFSLLMVPPNTLLMLWGMFRARRAARASGKR